MFLRTLGAMGVTVGMAGSALAAIDSHTGAASFSTDLAPNVQINLPQFNPTLGTLNSVSVSVVHTGTVHTKVDNDENLFSTNANGRLIRAWQLSGPNGGSAFGNQTILTPSTLLGPENGDGTSADFTGPDGTDFGTFGYTNAAPNFAVFPGPDATYVGLSTVLFDVDVQTMVNDVQFSPATPNAVQYDIQDSFLEVKVTVNYNYTPVPEPASLGLVGLGGVFAMRRRRA